VIYPGDYEWVTNRPDGNLWMDIDWRGEVLML